MKILFVAPSISRAYGGPTQGLATYLGALQSLGLESVVAAPACSAADLAWLQRHAPSTRIHTFPAFGSGALRSSPALLAWLWREAVRSSVVHVWGLINLVSSPAARVALHRGCATVICPLGMLSPYTSLHRRRRLKRAYFRSVEYPTLARAHAIHFWTDAERAEASWHVMPRRPPSYVIPPAASNSRTARTPRERGRTVLFLSRLDPKKNLEALLDAWSTIRARCPGARLIVAGDGDPRYVAHLRARARQVARGDDIVFLGFVEGAAKERALASADVFVLPSFHESFAVAALEAVESGIPVVISADVQLAPFIQHHGLGRVVADPAATLGSEVVAVLTDSSLRQRCARLGATLAASTFSSPVIGAQLHSMYVDATRRARERRAGSRLEPPPARLAYPSSSSGARHLL
jgi:glycosyltransferase involved in cell wall biosynthesis